jgi:tRNA threonylcarbamoyladenosine biosynthesis protein TsaE
LYTQSAGETERLGEVIGGLLQPGDVVALNGDLGAGKTCLARGVARGLGVRDRVTSPTFTLINEYNGMIPLYHMDMYRLGSPEELEDLGYEEYFFGPGATLLEWAGQVEQYLPRRRLDIFITKLPDDEEKRKFELVPHGERFEQMVKELTRRVRAGN